MEEQVFNPEVRLDEKHTWLRDLSAFGEPLGKIYDRLAEKENMFDSQGKDMVKDFLRNFVFEKSIGLIVEDEGEKLVYRTSEKEKDDEDWKPAEHVLHIRDCKDFFGQMIKLDNSIKYKSPRTNWTKYINTTNIWERATVGDLDDPVSFLCRMRAEIENNGILGPEWVNVANIKTRFGSEHLLVRESPSSAAYVEGPRTLHVGTCVNGVPNETDQIHSVIYGLDDTKKASIYSVILDPVYDVTEGKVVDRDKSVRYRLQNLEPDIMRIEGLNANWPKRNDEYDVDALNTELQRISTVLHERNDPHMEDINLRLVNLVNALLQKKAADDTKPTLDNRNEKLKRFNTISGGAAMVSLITTLGLLREAGVENVRIPTYLPFVQHIGKQTREEIHQKYSERLIEWVQILQGITDISIEEQSSWVILDIGKWSMELKRVNKQSRDLAGLFESLKERVENENK